MDVHSPYNPPTQNVLNFREKDFTITEREFLTNKVYLQAQGVKITSKMVEDLKILYDSEIHFVDEYLVKLFKIIETQIKKNCLVIIEEKEVGVSGPLVIAFKKTVLFSVNFSKFGAVFL